MCVVSMTAITDDEADELRQRATVLRSANPTEDSAYGKELARIEALLEQHRRASMDYRDKRLGGDDE